ncbi:MAG: FGGY family carbohydrate kinase, partial [Acidobacteriota bacterium]
MSADFLAIDLGAESGRTMLGRLHAGALTLDEVCRFPNEPVYHHGSLQWDVLRLWLEIKRGLERASGTPLQSIGVDTWGCDYALLGERGQLLENPYHYRDSRTDGVMEQVWQRVSREQIYAVTGIQFLSFNTLYQLYAALRATPKLFEAATTFLTIPDLLNYWMTGRLTAEFTMATTTQCVDAKTRNWATGLLTELGIPTRLLPEIVEPGAIIGRLGAEVCAALAGTPVVAPACHDTGSAAASVFGGGATALISSGTWSLFGTELPAPVVTPKARDLNFTNEGGVCGTTRLLKNIGGLWLLQACRRSWTASGQELGYDALLAAAGEQRPFRSLFDPDHRGFFQPPDMAAAIAGY